MSLHVLVLARTEQPPFAVLDKGEAIAICEKARATAFMNRMNRAGCRPCCRAEIEGRAIRRKFE